MEESFRFDEEIYENAITIDLSNVANKASALYSISKRTMDIVSFIGWAYFIITIIFTSSNTYKIRF